MRILVISHLYPSLARPGYGAFVYDQVRELAGLGCEVRVISPTVYSFPLVSHLRPRWKVLRAIPDVEDKDGIRAHYPRYFDIPRGLLSPYSGYLCYWGLRRTASSLLDSFDPDLIHAHTVLPDGFAAMLLNRRLCKPLVMTVHGYDVYRHLQGGGIRQKQVIRGLAAADQVICVSAALRRLCHQWLPQADMFKVIHNGTRFCPEGEVVHEQSKERQPVVVLTVGSLIPRKAHQYVLEAVAALKAEGYQVLYRIVGEGSARPDLEGLVRQLELRDVVTFVGQLAPDSLGEEYRACDVFVLPSWDEAFGVVYLEAMAHGKPVIACQGEGISDIITDGENGLLVPPRDTAALTAALRRLVTDREYASRIGEAGRKRASLLTWRRQAELLLALYREVVGARALPGATAPPDATVGGARD